MSNRGSDEPTVVCAWCGKITVLGSSEISHGICGKCAWTMLDESGLMDDAAAPGRSTHHVPSGPEIVGR